VLYDASRREYLKKEASMGLFELLIIGLVVGIACGAVLYQSAQATGRHPLLWAAIGFFTNVIGLLVWRFLVGPFQLSKS
jgi:hypothetical protein